MNCPSCKNPHCFIGLFSGYDCPNEFCVHFKNGTMNGGKAPARSGDPGYRGFIVYRAERGFPVEEYVFATMSDAERWRELNGIYDATIHTVRSQKPFVWNAASATIRQITMADRLFIVCQDEDQKNRYKFGPENVCLLFEEKE